MTAYLYVLCILGAISWFLLIFEIILSHSFWATIFKVGIPVKRISLTANTENFYPIIGNTIRMKEGKFYFTSERSVYFLSQFFVFKLFRFTTPFPFRAVATINPDNKVDVVARIPIGSFLFLLLWILGWTIGAIVAAIQTENFSLVSLAIIGWLFALLMIITSYPIEKSRLDLMIAELKQIIIENTKQ